MRSRITRSAKRCSPDGLTLVEVVIVISILGVLLLSGRLLIEQLSGTAAHVAASARSHGHSVNGEALLRDLLRGVEHRAIARFGSASEHDALREVAAFSGTPQEARFGSWCPTPGEWRERCTVSLMVAAHEDSSWPDGTALHLVLGMVTGAGTTTYALREAAQHGAFIYLESARDGGSWRHDWPENAAPPLALGIVTGNDTLVLRVGVQP